MSEIQFASPPPIDVTKLLAIIIVVIFAAIIISVNTGCNVQKKIEEAKKEAVRADRAENPCSNDTIFRLVPGEQLILIDTVHTKSTDTLFNWTYDTEIITKTIRKVDTIKAFIRDDYKINSLKDSINVHKLAESTLQGQIYQQRINISEVEKTAKNRLYIILALCSLIAVSFGVGVYFKVSTLGLKNLIK
jgi:hypothetical protein